MATRQADTARGSQPLGPALSRALAWGASSLGVLLLLAVFLEPYLLASPTGGVAATFLLAIQLVLASTGLKLLGAGLLGLAAFLALCVRRWTRACGEDHPRTCKRLQLWTLLTLAFSGGFVLARGFVLAGSFSLAGGLPLDAMFWPGEVWVNGYHLHHFFLGATLLAAAGAIGLLVPGTDRRWLAILYGVGLGIFVDEVGLLLSWGDYYAHATWFVAVGILALLLAGTLSTWSTALRRTATRSEADLSATEQGLEADCSPVVGLDPAAAPVPIPAPARARGSASSAGRQAEGSFDPNRRL